MDENRAQKGHLPVEFSHQQCIVFLQMPQIFCNLRYNINVYMIRTARDIIKEAEK